MASKWNLQVTRLGMHRWGKRLRTYGRYSVAIDDRHVPELAGFICETAGPGDNTSTGVNLRRVAEGTYSLQKQDGKHYTTLGYSEDTSLRMPGIQLEDRGARSEILIHPGHPTLPGFGEGDLFLSSIGCLNPTRALARDQSMDFWESRGRVIALIVSLRGFVGGDLETGGPSGSIANASVTILGEPMNDL